ncbi:MAG: glycosyltransferase family 39 protein [Candidatus Altiarchaeota archaeon]
MKKDKKTSDKNFEKKENFQRYLPLTVLLLITLLGFYIRIYHLDYPVIGYHNWKSVHYLSEARNFVREGFFSKGFFVPIQDYPPMNADPSGAHSDTFPLTPIIIAIAFKIFGFELSIARLVTIIFVVATIPLMYLISKQIFKREDFALVSAFLTAILPLTSFYPHSVELSNHALFFFILSIYAFLKWRNENKGHFLILASLSFVLSALTKYDFLIMGLLFTLLFPFERIKIEEIKKSFKLYLLSILILLLFPAWYYYSNEIVAPKYKSAPVASPEKVNYLQILNPSEWKFINSYIEECFTFIGLSLAFLGVFFSALSFIKSRKFEDKFLVSLFIASIAFFILMFFKIKGHSYHMYPLAPLFAISISYFIIKVADFSKKMKVEGKGVPYLNFFVIIIILLILFFPMQEATARQFDTQFFGLDVAGGYVKENKKPGERIIHSTHQAYGILWHADIKGTRGIPETVEKIKFAEENLNATWLFIYNWDMEIKSNKIKLSGDESRWRYIKENYALKQFAFIQTQQGIQPIYMLFRKGGSYDDEKLNTMLQGRQIFKKDYELTKGKVRLSYINF